MLKYIERNPVRAKLTKRAEDWQWGSAYIRQYGSPQHKQLLAESPTPLPRGYRMWIDTPDTEEDLTSIRSSVNKGTPYGSATWVEQMVDVHKLEATMRGRGRPTKD